MKPEWLQWILPGDIIVLIIIGAVMLFYYKNMWKRMALELEDKQSKNACVDIRENCIALREGIGVGVTNALDLRFKQISEQLTLILERQTQLIMRIDKHINGSHEG